MEDSGVFHITDSNGILTVQQHGQNLDFLAIVFVIGAIGLTFYFLKSRSIPFLVIPAVLLVFAAVAHFSGRGTKLTMQLDRPQRALTYQDASKHSQDPPHIVPLSEISSADMDFNRGATCIVLVLRSGDRVYPLGPQHLQDDDNQGPQYKILTAIRTAIGQTAPASKTAPQ